MNDEQNDEPPDSIEVLAEFTRKILQVPKDELNDSSDSNGTDEPSPET